MTSRNQYIFINSKNKQTGNPWDFIVNFDAGYIKTQDEETIKISLVKLTLPLVIHQVNSTNNQITFINASNQNTTITIPNGSYNVYELIKVFQSSYPAMTSASFDKSRNFFTFVFNTNHRITFNNKSNEIFGFSGNVTTPSLTISSNKPAKPNSIDNIVFNMYGVNPLFYNLDNLGGDMKLSHALAVLDIEDIPYGVLRYNNDAGEFAVSIHDNSIKALRFVMTDIDGNALDYANLQDFSFVLKIDYQTADDNSEMTNLLSEIKEYTSASYLHNALSSLGGNTSQ